MSTHYISFKKHLSIKEFKEVCNDCLFLYNYKFSDVLADWDGSGSPVFNDFQICFNGKKGEHADTFLVGVHLVPKTYSFDTKNKPYDAFVRCCMLVMKYHFEDSIRIDSSDRDEYLWGEANILINEVLGIDEVFCLDRVIC